MYDHVDRVEAIFKKAGIKFTRLKADQTFEHLMFDHWPNFREQSKFKNQGFSWPSFQSRWCTTLLKTEMIEGYLNQLRKEYTVIQLIGLAADETERLARKNNQLPNHRHPLSEWGWDEAYCLQYCYDRGFKWDGLYCLFHRVSCWCCPLQSLPELRNLRKHFPDLWKRLLDMEHRTWRKFRADYSVDELEIRFQFEEERLAAGLPINTREFHQALKNRIKEEIKK